MLLAASQRQIRALQLAYGQRMRQEGRNAWPSPDLVTWMAWLERCWSELSASSAAVPGPDSRILLTAVQETKLWEAAIRDSDFGDGLLQSHALAQTAEQAWRLSWEWDIPLPLADVAPNEDVRAFALWSRRFDERCGAQRWQDRARLAEVVARAFASGWLRAPKRMLLVGFEELTPQQRRLCEILRRQGTAVELIDERPVGGAIVRYELPGPLEEFAAAAEWARERLAAGVSRIGIVVPDLAGWRSQIARIFDDTLTPGAVLPGSHNAARPHNLSLGQALAGYPVVHTALLALELGKGELPCEEMGSLLRSPFLGGASAEWSRRALLDVAFRHGEPSLGINSLLRLTQDKDKDGCERAHAAPFLAGRLKQWRGLLDSFARYQRPSAWAEGFARSLMILGWPGDRPLDSNEYQTVEAWREILSVFSSLDHVGDRMDYVEALSTLRRLAAERVFQPKSPEVPIQIMGLLDAVGLEFDCLWVTGLHDAVWPGSPRPNPFIAIELQRQHGLPHASAGRELEFARRLTGLLFASAPQVIVSHPRRNDDEDLRPSPLIGHLPATQPEARDTVGALQRRVYELRPRLEQIADEYAPALPAGIEMRLGTGVFKDQAACPFRAFARARLGARALKAPEPGLDALERGTLLHSVLKNFWGSLRSHARLRALSDEALHGAIRVAVGDAVTDFARHRSQTFTARFTALERARLERLVLDWLALEKQRAPFTVILPEQDQSTSLGGLTIKIVPDRVDELEDGARMVVDYKTGTPKLSQWFGDRPDEPQLPIYALAQNNVAAVAFAQVRKDDSRFLGIAAQDGLAPNVRPVADSREAAAFESWTALLGEWRRVIEALGSAFREGEARADPKYGYQTCEYCDLAPLCRIRERDETSLVESGDAT